MYPTLPLGSHIQTVERFMNIDIFKNTYYRVFGTRSDKDEANCPLSIKSTLLRVKARFQMSSARTRNV